MSAAPGILSIVSEGIPPSLRAGKRFTGWRYEDRKGQAKPAKMPYSPDAPKGASSSNPSHWTTFEDALRYAQVAMLDGVMRAFDHVDGDVGIDLDNSLDPTIPDPSIDDLAPWAAEHVRRLDTYTEVSPSGTGVKLWAKGSLPPHGRKRGDVEMYGSVAGKTGPCGRFFTQTGRHLDGTPREVKYRPDAILAIHREVFGDAPDPTATVGPDRDGPVPALELGDEEVIRLASESPHNGERFRRLMAGDTGDYARDGNDGASEADGAICEIFAYYGGPDPDRIERLWLRSGLYRDKAERADYRARTIALALKGKTRFYGDNIRPKAPVAGSDGASACACEPCPAVAEVARLRRLALDRDDLVESQQAIIRAGHARHARIEALEGYLTSLDEVLARPNDELSATRKVLVLAATRDTHTRVSRGVYTTSRGRLADRTGMSASTVTNGLGDICTPEPKGNEIMVPDGRPFRKSVTRKIVTNPETGEAIIDERTGQPKIISVLELTPWNATPRETFRAAATFTPAERSKHGGSTAASDVRWGRCPKHQAADVVVKGYCGDCGKVLGEATVSAEEFEALKEQVDISGQTGQPVDVSLPKGKQVALSDLADELADRRAAAIMAVPMGRPVDAWKQPGEPNGAGTESLGRLRLTAAPDTSVPQGVPDSPGERPAAWRCSCGCMERRALSDGSLRCLKCGTATVAGVAS